MNAIPTDKPFPLIYFLLLIHKAHPRDIFVNYGLGARLLKNWLGDIETPKENLTPIPLGLGISEEFLLITCLKLPIHSRTIYWTLRNYYDNNQLHTTA